MKKCQSQENIRRQNERELFKSKDFSSVIEFHPKKKVLVQNDYKSFEIGVKPKDDIEKISFQWVLLSRNYKKDGELVIKVTPKYEDKRKTVEVERDCDLKPDEDFSPIFKLLEEMEQLNKQELNRIEPIIRQAMDSNIQDMDYLERITDPLWGLLFSGVGTELYEEYLNYVESFNPQRAKEYRDHDDNRNGVYDDLIETAADLAKEFHKGQVDKQGVDYFQGHLSTVGNAGNNWKEKVVGFLHDAAEDTPHTVDEIVRTLKDKSKGVLKDEDVLEISEALNLLNSNTAPSREEYIARIKESFIATKVKLNDLKHNMDISRIPNPTNKDMERTKRYRREYRQVLEYLGPVAWEWDEDEI